MKIIILGAGQVGSNLAFGLVSEANDITVVDVDQAKLDWLQDRYDLRTICGQAAHPSILRQAGAEDADMLVAVTQNDEINMLACKLAATLFRIPTKIARIRALDYMKQPEIFAPENMAVDFVISPEQEVTNYLRRLIDYPEALQVVDFADGRIRLVAMRAHFGGPLVGHELRDIRKHLPKLDARVAAIFRRDRMFVPEGRTVIEDGDEVFFIAATENIRAVMKEMRRADKTVRRVMIAGGGNIGSRLAAALEDDYQVKLIDRNKKNAEQLAAQLKHTMVFTGNATDEELLLQENVDDMDVFCALTNDDEDNIMSCLLAKRMGARKVVALINRSTYVDLLQGGEIDIALSPAQATISPLLTHIRRGDMVAVHSLRRGAVEAMEAVVHGDRNSSRLVGRRVEETDLPEGVSIGAILRGDEVIIAHHDTVIEAEDHVILFVPNKRLIPKVEKLFQVGMGFF
ncbi:trk system potassium uptake protein TrkA [Sulfuritortus calidifontis]|uniref:Trk system potassium uptake protein TrkA n=1 Tax=Sulfuritortus calidifontis TaxID=1914471 RepID=A0A4R3JTN0_9PROT|nr:Trk system potassium transporter TrkA [Sulfuritortus calidifontis]TCS69722.1 trk system potassium uptake protein TrkA [Sulfuritortus calidifontis]